MEPRLELSTPAHLDLVRIAAWDVKTDGKAVSRAKRDGIDLLYLSISPHHGAFYFVDKSRLIVYRIVDVRQERAAP